VAFTYDRYGHLFPEADTMAAAKLDAIRTTGLVEPSSQPLQIDTLQPLTRGRVRVEQEM
jgi:hypothetical protein